MKVVLAFFVGWLAARFGVDESYTQGYQDGIEVGHLQGVVEGYEAGHSRALEGTVQECEDYNEGVVDGYGEGFFAGVHKGFDCKMQQIDAFTFEC